ncbi:hypothetical protein [Moorena sp. SIOASIH]|nr:hypothetical protein [Moorena sp. SIOASIH]
MRYTIFLPSSLFPLLCFLFPVSCSVPVSAASGSASKRDPRP